MHSHNLLSERTSITPQFHCELTMKHSEQFNKQEISIQLKHEGSSGPGRKIKLHKSKPSNPRNITRVWTHLGL